MQRRDDAVGVDSDMEVFVYCKVIPGSLADHPEVIDEGVVLTNLDVEFFLCDTGRVVLHPRRQSHPGDSLRAIVGLDVKAAIAV